MYKKNYLPENPKFGSKDRKRVAEFCYCFFRLGNTLQERPLQDRIFAGYFLCGDHASRVIDTLRPEWASAQQGNLDDRISFLQQAYPDFSFDEVFPLPEQFSEGMEKSAFIRSHFVQPDLFLRPRPGKLKTLASKLQAAGISFRTAGEQGIALDNATRLEEVGVPDRDYVVQDLSSQQTVDFLPDKNRLPAKPTIWDACAGSGGKSIMAIDKYPSGRLYVSDVRPSILQNLSARFRAAGIRDYRSAVLDLSVTDTLNMMMPGFLPSGGFDLVIADVPCSGSGTWGRDPWALSQFGLKDLEAYAARQRSIVSGLLKALKPGGYLLYITCSVYAMENESVVAFVEKHGNLRVLKSSLLKGYANRADTLYAALFTSTRG